ncbi:MBL fold metallo-hydrolase [Paenibacillus sp. JX-17]|uniref:MBL fold metallo-hydrolase n=1 Tax=Paenibacillus lacisoli TaxID=3064525 RepID=A0ABT9CIK8_9BACL|nr:MBL fold metallo-hydrolase [Paenibacillus sp. JX-17]MDO7907511.1 MBL fold metallo-hydrolase [Paenibacillus sp. JX-17]
MIQLHVWGGAGEHGRSCYVLTGEHHRIMLDCGVKKEGTGQYPLLQEEQIPQLTAVFLSHAHEDHSMALPLLYKYGYKGEIWTTRPTASQLELYFASWNRYVSGRGGELPYDESDIQALRFRYLEEEGPAGEWLKLGNQLELQWGRSGHMLGSVWLRLQMERHGIFFSGDYSRESALLEADGPQVLGEGTDFSGASAPVLREPLSLSIVDNAYGTDEESQRQKLAELRRFILKTQERGGHLLLPVPAFGRGQDLVVWALKQFPGQRLLIEPEIWKGLQQMVVWSDWLRPEALLQIEAAMHSGDICVPGSPEERLRLLKGSQPLIIFTTDGMMESPRARWYAERLASASQHAIVITGHASHGTFARRLLSEETEGAGCEVLQLGYKIHQGMDDVRVMLQEVPSRHTVLVHAPQAETDRVVARLSAEGYEGLSSLEPGAIVALEES